MTHVPIESVALKLFTGIEKLRDHGDPVLHPGRQLPHPRRRRAAHDRLRHLDGRPLVRRPRRSPASSPARCSRRCRARRRRPSSPSARSSCRRWSQQGFPKRFGAGVITTSGALGILIPPSIVDGDAVAPPVRRPSTSRLGRQLFMAGVVPGLMLATLLGITDLVPRLEEQLSAHAARQLGRALARLPRSRLGPAADRARASAASTRGMFTPTEAAAMSAVYAFVVAVFVYKDMTLADVPRVLLALRQHERDAALHHHQRGAVLVPDDHEQIPQAMADWMHRRRASAGSRSCWWSTSCCCSPATSWSRPRSC